MYGASTLACSGCAFTELPSGVRTETALGDLLLAQFRLCPLGREVVKVDTEGAAAMWNARCQPTFANDLLLRQNTIMPMNDNSPVPRQFLANFSQISRQFLEVCRCCNDGCGERVILVGTKADRARARFFQERDPCRVFFSGPRSDGHLRDHEPRGLLPIASGIGQAGRGRLPRPATTMCSFV